MTTIETPSNFNSALSFVLANEGTVFTIDPADAGGATRYGITLRTLADWRRKAGAPVPAANDVRDLKMDEVTDIYRAAYWLPIGGDALLDAGISTCLFDQAVNNGPGAAARAAQAIATGIAQVPLTADGVIGPASIAAINKCAREPFLKALVARQMDAYLNDVRRRDANRKFLKGWLSRAASYLTFCV